MSKGKHAKFSPKCRAIIPLSKNTFPFSHVKPFGYNTVPNEGTITIFGKIWTNFPISPKMGDEAMNPITGY